MCVWVCVCEGVCGGVWGSALERVGVCASEAEEESVVCAGGLRVRRCVRARGREGRWASGADMTRLLFV